MFYVYEWFIKETNEIFYVGKGKCRRYKVRKHNRFFNDMIRRYDCDSRIIKYFDSEEDAFRYEYERIEELKKSGQCVCNIKRGGYGGTVSWWNDELREKYSKNNVMKAQAQRERMSKNNPMKNKKVAEIVGLKHGKPVVIGGKEYETIHKAMEAYNVSYNTIETWCKKGRNPQNELCRHKDSEQVTPSIGRYAKGGCKEIIYDGRVYEAIKDVADELGVSSTAVSGWAKKGFSPTGIVCRYTDDKRNLIFKKYDHGEKIGRPIYVNGVLYKSIRDAEKSVGVGKGVLNPYLRGERKSKKYICEYADQQPSRGNSDNSTAEGSTTNG